jgi:hypothetical protein
MLHHGGADQPIAHPQRVVNTSAITMFGKQRLDGGRIDVGACRHRSRTAHLLPVRMYLPHLRRRHDAISKLWAMMNRPQHRRLPGGASAEIGQGALIPAAPRDSARPD